MSYTERVKMYNRIQEIRQCPLIAYVTSSRHRAEGQLAQDALPSLMEQFIKLPQKCKSVDLFIVSNGGDPTVAWRIMSLLRERVKKISVLIPQSAYSAATLIALGADEIIMHSCGNLGPVDPQIHIRRKNQAGQEDSMLFGSEDLAGFLSFVKENVGLVDQEHIKDSFLSVCKDVGTVPIGIACRSSKLSISMGEKLLKMHMQDGKDSQKAKNIAEKLNKEFFHHGYPVGRREAKEIGLKIIEPNLELENLLWDVWLDFAEEMKCNIPFSPLQEIKGTDIEKAIYADIPQINIPPNLPQDVLKQLIPFILQQIQAISTLVPTHDFKLHLASVESTYFAQKKVINGKIFAFRKPDMSLSINTVQIDDIWENLTP